MTYENEERSCVSVIFPSVQCIFVANIRNLSLMACKWLLWSRWYICWWIFYSNIQTLYEPNLYGFLFCQVLSNSYNDSPISVVSILPNDVALTWKYFWWGDVAVKTGLIPYEYLWLVWRENIAKLCPFVFDTLEVDDKGPHIFPWVSVGFHSVFVWWRGG